MLLATGALLGRRRGVDTRQFLAPAIETRVAVVYKPILDVGRNVQERALDVDVLLGAGLEELDIVLFGESFALLEGHGPLVDITLVADQNLVHVDVGVHLDLRHPVADGEKGLPVGHIVDQQNALRPSKVRCRDGAEPFLSGRVPNL